MPLSTHFLAFSKYYNGLNLDVYFHTMSKFSLRRCHSEGVG